MTNEYPIGFYGRQAELIFLTNILAEKSEDVIGLYGLAGIGKSTLLKALTKQHQSSSTHLVYLDCESIEPTTTAFIAALSEQLSEPIATPAQNLTELKHHLSLQKTPILLILDSFEAFGLLETWLRRHFMPQLQGWLKLLLSGRVPPDRLWLIQDSNFCFSSLKLDTLSFNDAVTCLKHAGLSEQLAIDVNQFANGYPLVLRLAIATILEQPGRNLTNLPVDDVVRTLANYFLEDIKDPVIRQAIEAMSVVRRLTDSVLAGMLGDQYHRELYQQLTKINFVECRSDGLSLHNVLKKALAVSLEAREPAKYSQLRQDAWRVLRCEMKNVINHNLWRYTADIIYLVNNWVISDAFFPPNDSREYSVEPARVGDIHAILEIAQLYEPQTMLEVYKLWWQHAPEVFHCVRDQSDLVVGFYCLIKPSEMDEQLLNADPICRLWLQHLQHCELDGKIPCALFIRRWLSRFHGEDHSAIQAACWVDIKRAYISMRPDLHQVYMAIEDFEPYAMAAKGLGFVVLEHQPVIEQHQYTSAFLYFGRASIDGWISRTLMNEIDYIDDANAPPLLFDKDARQLITQQGRVDLTKLEYGTLALLIDNEGVAISRKSLLDKVWDIHYEGASNVVDTVVLSLRKKLGNRAHLIQSSRGIGYRFMDKDS
ncbi:MAG: winged helix-turn-helix domain-containing protein [Gammaproteobacteria bacterium]|nr:winged helix-turn-helix domain-containing protein [Gammaproteobacteria bacterium]